MVGKEVSVEIIGYGVDDDNEAYMVSLPSELLDIYENSYPVHVMLSVSSTGMPVDSKDLPFWGLDEPFTVTGTIGYFGFDGRRHLN